MTAAKFFPSATIHSFEIIPETAELMKEKILNTNIIVNSLGLADKNGLLEVKHFPNANLVTTFVPVPKGRITHWTNFTVTEKTS